MVEVETLSGVRELPADEWNALVGDDSPFLEWEWLASLEEAGCVTSDTGWLPQHLALFDGPRLVGACPLYVKTHSQGEFVFDHGWAQAAQRAGIRYYPQLLVPRPCTPAAGARFLAAPDVDRVEVVRQLGAALAELCDGRSYSSVHVNFCRSDEAATLAALGYVERTGYQFQWINPGW